MPYPKMGRTKQLTLRLKPEDAAQLAATAQARGVAQTVVVEELIRTLPEAPEGASQEVKAR